MQFCIHNSTRWVDSSALTPQCLRGTKVVARVFQSFISQTNMMLFVCLFVCLFCVCLCFFFIYCFFFGVHFELVNLTQNEVLQKGS
jgi:dolichyl-phosphate-mannose--protein O-mannosyl transferase